MQPTASDQFAPPRSTSRPTPRAGRLLLPVGVLGIWVFPVAIIVATNSWGPPDAEDYIRMAFGQVAGHTVAVLTALVLLGTSIRLRSRDAIIGWSLIALFVLGAAYSGLQSASVRLIQILG